MERRLKLAELIAVSDVPFDVLADSRAGWDLDFTQVEAGANPTMLRHLQLDGLSVGTERIPRSVVIRGSIPLGTVNLALANTPDTQLTFRGRSISRDTVIYQGPHEAVDAQYGGALSSLSVDPGVLEHHMGPDAVADALTQDHVHLPAPEATRLRTLCREAVRAFREHPRLQRAPLAIARLRLQVLDQIKQVFDRTRRARVGASQSSTSGRIEAAKRAEEFARDNLRRSFSIRELAKHAGVGERTLRTGFMERFGHSPKKHLIALRLNAARAALRTARAGEASVTQIAIDSGFWHLSRFANAYRRMFGELPSHTLREAAGA